MIGSSFGTALASPTFKTDPLLVSEPHHVSIHAQRPFREDSLNSNPAEQPLLSPASEAYNGGASDQQSFQNISLTSISIN